MTGVGDEAVALLQRTFDNYSRFSTEPTFDALKDDPRWVALGTAR